MNSDNVVSLFDGATGKNRNPSVFRPQNRVSDGYEGEHTKIRQEVQNIRHDIKQIKEVIEARIQLASSENGGGEMMEKIQEKLSEIDKKVAVIEERTKKIDNLPTKEEMKNLISETISNSGIATKEHVELKIISSRNVQIVWTIATFIALASATIAAIKLF
ncbi:MULTISPECIES: hypothetical protein [Bacillus]|jgi:hypothetical protein|uniref:Uncharacterized protein n=1 Tax=Bacillus sonorensis TaxID=119858 RepID=A0ABN5AKD8_9BACI|nr:MULTISPECIES: hypothetical protein [Bacillus]ASB90812.1 hypothetical protein S101395_04310 [Bacillus sonorensis]AYC51103.1 hypothetical protein C7M53_07500 [Bacillus licheniformis]KJE30861.1 hypothetical protein LG49_2404 [Bacillus licheniformis]KJH58258.1 hypothetical protein UF14_07325 [Bacillus licheniformis]MCY8548711.1 hypothetical protein [Bacillus haynesii]